MATRKVVDEQLNDDNVLETWLLVNSDSYASIFQRIFDKYDRDFHEAEVGGQFVDFSDEATFEAQLEKLLKPPSRGEIDESIVVESSSSDEEDHTCSDAEDRSTRRLHAPIWRRVSPTQSANPVDPLVTQKLHEKVLKIKKEINWDVEEKKHQEILKMKAKADSSSSSSDDDLTMKRTCIPACHLADVPSGLESGYPSALESSFAIDKNSPSGLESRYAVNNGSQAVGEDCPSGLESGYAALEHGYVECLSGLESGYVVGQDNGCKNSYPSGLESGVVHEDCPSGLESGYVLEQDDGLEGGHHTPPRLHRKKRRRPSKQLRATKRKMVTEVEEVVMSYARKS